jgi:hypothetical protein
MRYSVIIGACLCAIGLPGPAHAVIEVNDTASILMEAKQLAQEAKQYLVQAQQYAKQIEQYAVEYQEMVGFIHDPTLGAARLATATTPKDVMDAQAALQAEQAWTQNLQGEINAAQINYQAQLQVQTQRENEGLDQSADQFLEAARAQGMGLDQ